LLGDSTWEGTSRCKWTIRRECRAHTVDPRTAIGYIVCRRAMEAAQAEHWPKQPAG
jgi:hypothetical protein